MAICGIVSFLTIYFDLSFLLQYFYRGDAIEEGWSKIHSMGRYAGLFNSPFEAGLGASLALLLAIYSMGQKKSMGLFFLFIVSLACLAGILSVSKVFLLGGITLAVIQFVSIRQVKLVIYALIISGLFFSFSLQAGFEDDWVGSSYLARLYDFSGQNYNDLESVVNLYSAGRLTKASYTLYWYDFVTETSPIIGHGFGINYSLIIPLDSFFSDVIAFCGFIGIIISLAIFYVFIRPVLLLSSTSIQERVLLVMLNFLALGSSLGANPFTVNSVSMTVFTVWFLLYNKSYHDSHGYQTDLPTKNGHPHQLDYDPERGGQDDPKKNQLVPEILSS
jgi:hypothetical protein